MSLRDRLQMHYGEAATQEEPAALHKNTRDSQAYQDIKLRAHLALLDQIDLKLVEKLSPTQRRDELKCVAEKVLVAENVALNDAERKNVVRDVLDEVLGLGPLEPLLADPSVSDILVNTCDHVYVERRGKLEETGIRFSSNAHLMKIIDKIVSGVGRRIDESSPMVDARLADGSRVNVIIPPLAVDGPVMSIRRFGAKALGMQDLIALQSLTPPMAQLLEGMVKARLNVLVSGGTGSGKTTMLNILSGCIGADERVVTIEDTAELRLQQPHVVRLESRPANIEGKGEISQRALVKNALRMRPDRIVVGEVRGPEAIDMLQAMNTGHDGSLATLHANTPRDALLRLENMIALTGISLPARTTRQMISSAVSVVLQVGRLSDGKRRVLSVQEVTGMEGDVITMQEIFSFRQTGMAADGSVRGYFCATGTRPRFCERLQLKGITLPEGIFDPQRHYDVKA
ncbi:CpaF family protein [Noviherbaspirillum malthae]|uniref:CpaF family protein n=1 Tax=Noviherbaspirillum malthae TaxID=1260987 RepID=UPI00188DD7A5|nr:CpaF family protein [Noviherbaspirillum malthae]